MPWTGPYTFTRDNGAFTGALVWTDDRNAGTKITSDHHDTHDQDIADGFALCLRNDGAGGPTANIPYNTHINTGMGLGSASTDSARTGQTITAASLDAGTNVLTLTRADGDVTVDLSALAVGGSTADFARLSATQTFAGINTFSQAPQSAAGYSIPRTTGNVTLWRIAADNSSKFSLIFSGTYNGSALEFIPSGNNAGTLYVCGQQVALTADIAGILTTSQNATITGTWTFTAPCVFTNTGLTLPGFQWTAGTGGTTWLVGPDDASQLSFTDPGGLSALVYVIDAAPKAGAYLQIGPNAKRCWDQGSLQSGLTAAPTGGEDGNLAVVESGADRGLWTRMSGVWTKLIAFP